MKRGVYFLVGMFLLFGTVAFSQDADQKLDVIYFHATRRCATCMAIEENTLKALETFFPDQLKKGTVKMSVINVDDDKNKAIAEKYEAAGSALYISKTVGGKESKTDMTDFAFSYARTNPEKFMNGLRDKINTMLK